MVKPSLEETSSFVSEEERALARDFSARAKLSVRGEGTAYLLLVLPFPGMSCSRMECCLESDSAQQLILGGVC